MFYSKKLKKFKSINHCFFSRKRGFSKGIYYSLNCGRGSKDKKENIKKNLFFVSNKLKIKPKNLILMHQTHSNKVIIIDSKNIKNKIFKADAIVTKMNGFALGVVTADCVPVILYDVKNKIIGCIHAGWKGAVSGIIENTILKFKRIKLRNKIYASIGPCIGRKNYEVGLEFYTNLVSHCKKNTIYFSKKSRSKKLFNLRKYVADKLIKLNVIVDHVNHDTFKDKNNFFSYRRSQKLLQNDYGRCISGISLIK